MPYYYFECPDCEFSLVLSDNDDRWCPLCISDSGHKVTMKWRNAVGADKPEGVDQRSQHDDHIWMTIGGEAWAIRQISDNKIFYWRGYAPFLEYTVIDVRDVNWALYCEHAVKKLEKYNEASD